MFTKPKEMQECREDLHLVKQPCNVCHLARKPVITDPHHHYQINIAMVLNYGVDACAALCQCLDCNII